jgi:DNA-binding transcriptional LysR family regulator
MEKRPPVNAPVDLAKHNCLRYAFYPFGDDWRFEGPIGEVSAHVAGNVVSNEATLLRLLTLRGRGIFLAPSFVVADELAAGTLVRLLPDYRPVEFSISAIYPHRNHLSSKLRLFIDLLSARFAEHRRWMV